MSMSAWVHGRPAARRSARSPAERRATARYFITPGLRYRLMARALTEDYEQRKDAIDAFFSSFKVLAQAPR